VDRLFYFSEIIIKKKEEKKKDKLATNVKKL
jgi:hypothetical protein